MVEPGSRPPPCSFRKRFAAREQLTGTFVKTPTPEALEAAVDAKGFKALGAGAFIVSSDQGFLRRVAGQTLAETAELGR